MDDSMGGVTTITVATEYDSHTSFMFFTLFFSSRHDSTDHDLLVSSPFWV